MISQRVKKIMSLLQLGATQVAEKGNLPVESVRSVLKGISKNPGAETLKGLAKAFECTVDVIISDEEITLETLSTNPKAANHFVDINLYRDAIFAVEEAARSKKISLAKDSTLLKFYVNQVYEFAMERAKAGNAEPIIDMVFVNWLLGKGAKTEYGH